MNYWAMRTCRDDEKSRRFIQDELSAGRLRQGWGSCESQNLRDIETSWANGDELTDEQREASRHWRMGNGTGDDYMQVNDLVVVPNMPVDGLFTICRITGEYDFSIDRQHGDFGHIRPVRVEGPKEGVANTHELVHAALRRSFRCQSRMWNITPHQECLNTILKAQRQPGDFSQGVEPAEQAESVVSELITEPLNLMADRIGANLPSTVRSEEWERVLRSALEPLFPVSVHHTGGRHERGADIEIVIPNPFVDNREWIVPVQVKDYDGEVGGDGNVAEQLETAFRSRNQANQVIAVVLLVTNAKASEDLKKQMDELSEKYHVPFLFCGRERFMRLLARGYLRRS